MYNVQDLDDKGRVSLPGFIKHYVGTQLAGKNCKGDVCTKEEQARYDHIAEEANEEVKEMIKVFRSADLDSDQKLSKETFLKTISALQLTGDIQDVAWKVIALVDDNHDNMLSYDELIDNGKKFGAATEDFFKDVDVLYIEGDETDKGIAGRSAFVKAGVDETKQRRLRGGLV
jgi:Ca2+-binding EF-hand superfamily protein